MANDTDTDLAILVVGAARVVADRLGDAVTRAGIEDMRAPFGYVIRVLADGDRTLTDVAALLGVSKQAAIKVVDEMETRGFLSRRAHPDDRRLKLLRLTAKGRQVRHAALDASHKIEHDLRAEVGDAAVTQLRQGLEQLLSSHGVLDDAHAGRSRALW